MSDEFDNPPYDFLADIRLEVSETARPALFCFQCGNMTPTSHDEDVIGRMLTNCHPLCSTCGKTLDVLNLLRLALMHEGNAVGFTVPIGLRHTIILYRLPIGRIKELDLRREGIPPDAQILRVVHRNPSMQDAIAVDIDALDTSRRPNFQYRMLGLWRGTDPPPDDVQGDAAILWAMHDVDDVGRQQLVHAMDAFTNNRIAEAIIPANVAVEHTLGRVINDYFEWVGVAKDRRKSFARDAATFSHQLNVLSPAIAHHLHAPPLSGDLRGSLNRLRELRNDAAHAGPPVAAREDVVDCMVAAVVGFRYARLPGELLDTARSTG